MTNRTGRALMLPALLGLLTAAACGTGDAIQPAVSGRSQPAPETSPDRGRTARGIVPHEQPPPPTTVASEGTPAQPAPAHDVAPVPRASLTDRRGDVPSAIDTPPAYVDILEATLTGSDATYTLTVTAAAPYPDTGSATRTMNLALLTDTTGDGTPDAEVWATLADDGWYPGVRGHAGTDFGDATGVVIHVSSGRLVIDLPARHLGGNATFAWALYAEWSRNELAGTPGQAWDRAPDHGYATSPEEGG